MDFGTLLDHNKRLANVISLFFAGKLNKINRVFTWFDENVNNALFNINHKLCASIDSQGTTLFTIYDENSLTSLDLGSTILTFVKMILPMVF